MASIQGLFSDPSEIGTSGGAQKYTTYIYFLAVRPYSVIYCFRTLELSTMPIIVAIAGVMAGDADPAGNNMCRQDRGNQLVLPMNTRSVSFHGRDGLRAVRLII